VQACPATDIKDPARKAIKRHNQQGNNCCATQYFNKKHIFDFI
jgi:hypothetical protein